MTGQDAVGVATNRSARQPSSTQVMKLGMETSGGGAALSVKAVTGKPIIFARPARSRLEDFEHFHPDRMSSRDLGMRATCSA